MTARAPAVLGSLAAVAAVAAVFGIGALRGGAAPAQPTAFELTHGRVLSIVGAFSSDVTLATRRVVRQNGHTYEYFDEAGTANVSLEIANQKGKKFEIRALAVGPATGDPYDPYDPYGGGYGDPPAKRAADTDDALRAGTIVRGKLRYIRKRRPAPYQQYFDEVVEMQSSATLAKGTKLKLSGDVSVGGYDGYGSGFDFNERGTRLQHGVTGALAGGKQAVYVRGFRLSTGTGVLHFDAVWEDGDSGTVTFTAPAFLDGKTGLIRRKTNGDYQVTGPQGFGIRITVRDDGSGSVNLGLGTFRVEEGAFQVSFD